MNTFTNDNEEYSAAWEKKENIHLQTELCLYFVTDILWFKNLQKNIRKILTLDYENCYCKSNYLPASLA